MAKNFMMSITTNMASFVSGVVSDNKYFKDESIKELDDTMDRMVVAMRRDVAKKTWSLHDSIRKTSWEILFGKSFWRKRVTAGGYVYNPDTGRLVDYSEVVEYGSQDSGQNRPPDPYFWVNVHREIVKLDSHIARVVDRTSKRVGARRD